MAVLYITPGPTVVVRREYDRWRWCFKCRRQSMHFLVVLDYDRQTYYEPVAVSRCAVCNEDHTDFPS